MIECPYCHRQLDVQHGIDDSGNYGQAECTDCHIDYDVSSDYTIRSEHRQRRVSAVGIVKQGRVWKSLGRTP